MDLRALVQGHLGGEVGGRAEAVDAQPATRRLIGMANFSSDLQLDGIRTGPAGRPAAAAGTRVRRARRATTSVTGDLVATGHGR